jgi:DnaJ-class molecular chaperone
VIRLGKFICNFMPVIMKECPACSGSGNCEKCNGLGYVYNHNKELWSLGTTTHPPCNKCDESGNCKRCNGKGVVPDDEELKKVK